MKYIYNILQIGVKISRNIIQRIDMPRLVGLMFSNPLELLIIMTQILCYANIFYTLVFLLGPRPFLFVLILTIIFSRAILAFYMANSTHLQVLPTDQSSAFCKKCKQYIQYRDHHCIFLGRCVEKSNYKYFLSYVLYSYILTTALITSVALDYKLIMHVFTLNIYKYMFFFSVAICSSLFGAILTGGLLSGCFRSIIQGVYTVEELKKIKTIKYTNSQLRCMWFSSTGRHTIKSQFVKNWKIMIGEVGLKQILFVL